MSVASNWQFLDAPDHLSSVSLPRLCPSSHQWKLLHVEAALEASQFLKNNASSLADSRSHQQLHVDLSKLKWILKAGFDAKLEECGERSSLYLFRRCVSKIENSTTGQATVVKLANILGT